MTGRFVRLAEMERPKLAIEIDGRPSIALEGDTLLVALLTQTGSLRVSEFGDGSRAGFCLMGACQDCWVWVDGGRRVRGCGTEVAEGMAISTTAPRWDAGSRDAADG